MLRTFSNTFFSGKRDLTDYQKSHTHKYFHCNRPDKFLDIQKIEGKMFGASKTDICRASKEALEYFVMTLIGKHF